MAGKFFLHVSAGAVQNDSVVQTVGGYIFFNPSFQRAIPINMEIPFLVRFNESAERADGQISPFLAGESSDVNERFAGEGRFSGRFHRVGVVNPAGGKMMFFLEFFFVPVRQDDDFIETMVIRLDGLLHVPGEGTHVGEIIVIGGMGPRHDSHAGQELLFGKGEKQGVFKSGTKNDHIILMFIEVVRQRFFEA